ncbi:MAG: hypothetical protein K0R65_3057 [Crocinitomicaceae bacterium]|jgi:hypothetical protein|nr:hypothetical protein [Crocinitomicaceae bacterium]
MKKIFTPLTITLLSSFCITGASFGQSTLAIYNFNGTGQENCTNRIVAPESPVADLTFSDFSISNLTCVQTANQFNNDGWNMTPDIDLTEYAEFTITADAGHDLDLDSLYFDLRSSQLNGDFHVRSSVDNFANDLTGFEYFDGVSWVSVPSIDIPDAYLTFRKAFGASYDGLDMITFRFYATSVLAASTTVRLDNVIPIGVVGVDNVSVKELDNAAFSVFPNPGTDELKIETKSTDDLNIRIFTAKGKLVTEEHLSAAGAHTVNTSRFDNGVYFIEVSGTEGKVTQRWIKQ